MVEPLRLEYEKYLARYRLKPRRLPPREEREAGQREIVRIQYEEAKSRGDPMAESILTAYEENRERYLAETRHPVTIQLEETARDIEETIRAVPAFAGKFRDDVFVGECPTGSINCETVKVDGGFLILVNSGTLSMLQQVVTFLSRGEADHPGSDASLNAANGVAEVLANYIEIGDPFYGPKPVDGGMLAVLSGLLAKAARKFVVAHEYAHILAGHFAEAEPESIAIETEVGAIEVLKKNYEQEYEADEIGYRLTLGVEDYNQFDLTLIDAGFETSDLSVMHAAAQQKSLIAAPFVPLTIDLILSRFSEAMHMLGNKSVARNTHPPASDRIERLLASCPSANPRHCGFVNIPFMLLPSVDRILKIMTNHVLQKTQTATTSEAPLDGARPYWQQIEDIRRCVEAIRGGDYPTAAHVLADAFEKDRSILEPDVDVVCRELVRTALGRETDIRRTLLDRHNTRRALERQLELSSKGPLAYMSGLLPQGPPPSLADLAELVSNKIPEGLDLVDAALEEAKRRESPRAELHLLYAVQSAWRGDRERVRSSIEEALNTGVNDTGGRLARFVELDQRAAELEVRLDIQELLTAVGRKALSDEAGARELAELVKAYTEYLGIPLGPLAQRMVDIQFKRD